MYKFRLQKLLDIRLDKEEEGKRNFKEAQRQKNIVEEKLDNLKGTYKKYKEDTREQSVVERKLKHMYLNALNNTIDETKVELKSRISTLEDKRQDLKNRQIERKTVESLKEKQQLAFNKEQQLIEQKNNDEFALYGFIRNLERR